MSFKIRKRLLIKSIFDPNPVIFLEHRWLHEIKDKDWIDVGQMDKYKYFLDKKI